MAATYLTIGSKFRPFSYDELVRPLREATEAHQALETEYADLDTKAGVWENIANEQTDPIAYRMYKQYSDDLRAQADALATQGLTPGARQNLMKMKGRYSQEITPIENAYTRRRTLADEQRRALAENPTLMFQRDVNTMSLDDFIANPELDYGASYSGVLLTQQVSNAAANLRREMQNNPRKWQSILGGQYYETLMRTGFTSDEINKAIAGAEDANPILTGIVNDVLSSSGMSNWADKSTMSKARAYANQGLWGAIGETNYDTLQNRQWDLAAKAALEGPKKDPKEDPFSVITFTGGVDSTKNPANDRLVAMAEAIIPGSEEGTYTTPEFERLREDTKYSDEEYRKAQELIISYYEFWGTPTVEPTHNPEKVMIVRRMPDGTINNSKVPPEQQRAYEDARKIVNNGRVYLSGRQEFDNLIEKAKFFAGENASPNEVRDAAIRYASYLRNKQSTENVRINASLKDSALNNKVMMDWTNAVSGELEQGNVNSVSIVENGISRPLKESEIEELQNILSDSTNFTVHFDSTVKDENGTRTPIVFTYKGTGNNDAISFTINTDIHMDMIREYNTMSDFLTDFEPSSLQNAPTLYNPSYAEVLNLSKESKLPGGIQGLVYYDGSRGEYVKAVALTDRNGNIRIFSETMTDLAQPDRGGLGLGDYIEFAGEEFLRTTYGI